MTLECLEHTDSAINTYRNLIESFNNRFTLKDISIPEKYLEGRISIALNVHFTHSANGMDKIPIADNHANIFYFKAILAFNANVRDFAYSNDWDQKSVFIHSIETIDPPQGIIPSLVRLYNIEDQSSDFGSRGDLYFSFFNSDYKILPSFMKREMNFVASDNTISNKIKGCSQIMNYVTDDKRNFPWNGLSHTELNLIISSIRIFLYRQAIKISSFEKLSDTEIKLVDMMYCTF